MYLDAFTVGLDYATEGTGEVNGRTDRGHHRRRRRRSGQGRQRGNRFHRPGLQDPRRLGVVRASGLQVAPLAAENQVLFISGPAATDGLTGINKYTFRSGRQSYQDVKTAASFLPDLQGKKVTVFAQDNAFGQAQCRRRDVGLRCRRRHRDPAAGAGDRHRPGAVRQAGRRLRRRSAVRRLGGHQRHPDVGIAEPAGRLPGFHRGHRARHQADPHGFHPGGQPIVACWRTTSTARPTTRSSRRLSPGWRRRARPRTCSRRTASTPR